MKRIDKLTPEQEARFPEWTKKWIDIGLSTEPADFESATEAALKAYKLCNLDKPMVVLRFDSPYAATLGGIYAWSLLKELFKNQVQAQVQAQVGAQVWDQVRYQVQAQVRYQVQAQVRDQVQAQVWDQVQAQVGAQVQAQVWDQVRDQVGDGVYNNGIDCMWSSFTSWISFFRDVCGLELKPEILENFEMDEQLVKSCGWTWWHQNVLAISDRPKSIKRDNEGRLHCETGPSMEYRDGWALYHWHGVAIPKEWVTGHKPSAKEALTWSNIEQRRAACELVGWGNILSELNAKVIDKDDDLEIGTLLEVDLPDSGKELFLQVMCGTGRSFTIPVPKDIKTALEGNAWTYGLDALNFKPEVRT